MKASLLNFQVLILRSALGHESDGLPALAPALRGLRPTGSLRARRRLRAHRYRHSRLQFLHSSRILTFEISRRSQENFDIPPYNTASFPGRAKKNSKIRPKR
ncbi:unnamed protein product, partial [Nesidiocoris tenuis]